VQSVAKMQKSTSFTIHNFNEFKIQMLNWVNQFNIFCFLDNQQYNATPSTFECLVGVGCKSNIAVQSGNAFNALKEFSKNKQWLFGHFGYDLKNDTEQLQSNNLDILQFADLHFFEPQIVLQLSTTTIAIYSNEDANEIFEQIKNYSFTNAEDLNEKITIQKRFTKEEYIQTVNKIKHHIARGDCYELNFCQEFYAEDVKINPLAIYKKLSAISPTPFSAFYRHNSNYCICTSPERYLKKENNTLISQPIKGTAKRSKNAEEDAQNKNHLLTSQKERSENVMVVDLVRNDLSRICKQGTVKVQELFGIYTFAQVHQMISTVVGEVDDAVHWVDMIKATYPMGSMTGAPKKRVMELIEQYEKTKRGLFSGAIGYIAPNGNFDFNVVIRSILYNAINQYLSFTTGGAITFYSDAQKEYEECLLKAEGMMRVVG
jgi:para-aminobenzoate synthetase component I